MTIKQIVKLLEYKYPLKHAEDWDNCGLLLGSKKKTIKKILICLDLTTDALDEAIISQVDLIITHHPLFFNQDKDDEFEEMYKNSPYKKSIISRLDNTGMALYTAHTNFDAAADGMGDSIVKELGMVPKKVSSIKYGRLFETSKNKKQVLKLLEPIGIKSHLSNVEDDVIYKKIMLLPGSGSIDEILESHKIGCDLIITADIKWHNWVTFNEMNINLIQISHSMEDVFVKKINKVVLGKFKDVETVEFHIEEIASN